MGIDPVVVVCCQPGRKSLIPSTMLPPRDVDEHEPGPIQPSAPGPEYSPRSTPTVIDLVSTEVSKIINVNLYTNSRAEITRVFRLSLSVAGAHQLNINGLPRTMDGDSLRVESRGPAKPTIHEVSTSTILPPPLNTNAASPLLVSLQSKETKIQKSLKRTQNSLSSLNTYLSSIKASNLDASRLKDVIKECDEVAGELDEKVLSLEEELKATRKEINEEYQRISKPPTLDPSLNMKATVVVSAESAGEMEMVLIYAVRNATWNAGYDIRVSTSSSPSTKPITLIYKALISQSTGESWSDVPLTLHTSAPTFGADVQVPILHPWTIYVYRPEIHGSLGGGGYKKRAPSAMLNSSSLLGDEKPKLSTPPSAAVPPPPPPPLPAMKHRGLQVSSPKGGVSATFSVPGLITIPSDADVPGSPSSWHNVTIATLALDAKMSWVCVPKKDTRVYLKAKIKNASEYTFLPGSASVYVDGSFISKSDVPLVSPEERFDCPLGVDPAIRVTYHPRSKTVTKGSSNLKFYAPNTTKHAFTQCITIHNTKPPVSPSTSASSDEKKKKDQGSTADVKLRLIDQFPVSEDSTIRVKLIQPPLILPSSSTGTTNSAEKSNTLKASVLQGSTVGPVGASVPVSSGVTARWDWDGADEEDELDDAASAISGTSSKKKDTSSIDPASIGRDGRFLWDCSIPPQGRISLTMQWEVVVPDGAQVNVDAV